MKNKLLILVSMMCLLALVAACNNDNTNVGEQKKDSDNAPQEQSTALSAKGEFPIVTEKATLNVLMQQKVAVLDYEDNAFTKYLEEKTNVHINWTLVPEKDWNTKINLLLAGGEDLPDIIMGGVGNELLAKYGGQGIFQPLNDLIEEHSVEFKKVAENVVGVMNIIQAPDGKIYSLPKISECYNCTMAQKLWINKTFLDNVGHDIPETTEDFYQMLKAFKEKDPNKNGKADEIPLIGATNGWFQNIDGFLMNPFIFNDGSSLNATGSNRLILEGDKIEAAFAQPGWKQGLAYLKKLVGEKLLDPVSFSQDQSQLRQLVENSDAMMVGAVPSGGFHVFANVNGERKENYVTIPPLKGPDGTQQAMWSPYAYTQVPGMFVLTSSCKEECADIAMKWADQFYDEEVTARSRLGVPEIDWKLAPAGVEGVNGEPAKYEAILQWGADQKSHWAFINPGYWPRSWTEGPVKELDNPYELQYALTTATAENYEPYKRIVVPPLFMTAEAAEEFTQLNAVIRSYVEESIARFVLNDRDLEKDWDDYLKELENMGLTRYLELAQETYDRQWK